MFNSRAIAINSVALLLVRALLINDDRPRAADSILPNAICFLRFSISRVSDLVMLRFLFGRFVLSNKQIINSSFIFVKQSFNLFVAVKLRVVVGMLRVMLRVICGLVGMGSEPAWVLAFRCLRVIVGSCLLDPKKIK